MTTHQDNYSNFSNNHIDKDSYSLIAGQLIRRIREYRKISQSELADRAGTNTSYISTVENGKNNISICKASMICNGLEIPVASLMTMLNCIYESLQLTRQQSGD